MNQPNNFQVNFETDSLINFSNSNEQGSIFLENIQKVRDLEDNKNTKSKNKMWKVGGSDSDSENNIGYNNRIIKGRKKHTNYDPLKDKI